MSRRVVVTDHAFQNVEREAATARQFDASFSEYACSTEEETRDAVAGASVVFVNLAPITANVLRELASGAVVIRYGVGVDNSRPGGGPGTRHRRGQRARLRH